MVVCSYITHPIITIEVSAMLVYTDMHNNINNEHLNTMPGSNGIL